MRTVSWVSAAISGPRLKRPALDISLTEPPIAMPPPVAPEPEVTVNDIAAEAINTWLAAKREALGQSRNITSLDTALVDPALSRWRNQLQGSAESSWYWEYDHAVEILTVEPDDPNADALVVEARVQEKGSFYEFGQLNEAESYESTLNMRYNLVRQDDQWFVQDINELD